MKAFEYARPQNLSQALEQGGTFKAGGVDLLSRMKRGTLSVKKLVDISALQDLRFAPVLKKGELWIGAGLPLARLLEAGPLLPQGIRQAAAGTATPQIRNQASLVGNLLQEKRCLYLLDPEISCLGNGGKGCPARDGHHAELAILEPSPCLAIQASNLAPILCALDARLFEFQGKDNLRSLRAFYQDWRKQGERPKLPLIHSIRIPAASLRGGSAHHEVRVKQSFDWAIATAAAHLVLDGDRVARVSLWLGSVSDIPYQAKKVEQALQGKAPTDFKKALALLDSDFELHSPQQDWKRKMALLCAEKALRKSYDNAKEQR